MLDDDVTSSNVLFSTSSDEIAVEHTCGEIGHVAPFPPGGLTMDATAGGDPYAAREQLHAALRESLPALDALEENAASADASQLDQRLLACPPGVPRECAISWDEIRQKSVKPTPAALSAAKAADELVDVSAGPSLWAAIEADAISPKAYDAAAAPGARSSRRHDDDDDGAAEARACDPPAAAVDGPSATAAMTPPDLDAGTEELERWLDTLTLEPIAACDVGEEEAEAAPPEAVATALDVSDFESLLPNPVRQFPFELDAFQKQAIARLENHECVFVSTHPSAGKTAVAEYAIAMAAQNVMRAVYTAPTRLMLHQKFGEFKASFGDDAVGLLTGDVCIRPEAPCVVMTIEVLRSLLYRGAGLVRDLEWAIFDEVHLQSQPSNNDGEHWGGVWEEVMVLLPDHADFVCLSAIGPNTHELCDWIGRTKRKRVHTISTEKRPVPLQHYLYAAGGMHKVMDRAGKFLSSGHTDAASKLREKEEKKAASSGGYGWGGPGWGGYGGGYGGGYAGRGGYAGGRGGRGGYAGGPGGRGGRSAAPRTTARATSAAHRVAQPGPGAQEGVAAARDRLSFSKKKCEECADTLRSLDLLGTDEKVAVHHHVTAVVRRLRASETKLPQVARLAETLKRGVGILHEGLIPIMREMVEVLFASGFVRVLFTTEGFAALGVNAPARTVVFNGLRKHDGRGFRDLLAGEYTQMAGRAGRRGHDRVGTVIITCWNDVPPLASLKAILTGPANEFASHFRLSYRFVLNLARAPGLSVEELLKRTFAEFATQRALGARDLPALLEQQSAQLAELERRCEAERSKPGSCAAIEEFFSTSQHVARLNTWLQVRALSAAKQGASSLAPGRLVLVSTSAHAGAATDGDGATDFFVDAPALVLQGVSSTDARRAEDEGDAAASGGGRRFIALVLCPASFVAPTTQGAPPSPASFSQSAAAHGAADSSAKFAPPPTGVGYRGRDSAPTSSGPAIGLGLLGVFRSGLGRVHVLLELGLDKLVTVGKARRKLDADAVLRGDVGATNEAVRALVEAEGAPTFEPLNMVKDLRINDLDFAESAAELANLLKRRDGLVSRPCAQLATQYALTRERTLLREQVDRLRHMLSNESLGLFPDYQKRLQVLHKLGHISDDGAVALKGRVASEVNSVDELVATEIVFDPLLSELEPAEIAAVLSALVVQDRTVDSQHLSLTPHLLEACKRIEQLVHALAHVQRAAGLELDTDAYVLERCKFGLVEVVHEWTSGQPFSEVMQLTSASEGAVVRTTARVRELCCELRSAARLVGDPTLYRRAGRAIELLRDCLSQLAPPARPGKRHCGFRRDPSRPRAASE